MSHRDLEKKESERNFRRQAFYSIFFTVAFIVSAFALWKLRSLLLPVVVGALLAYLFRPIKDRFRIRWLPHELGVLAIFAAIGLLIFVGIYKGRQLIPDERQKLELKVRMKYKANEKFREIVGTAGHEKTGIMAQIVRHEFGPMMDQMNSHLELTADEKELFLNYVKGYQGQDPIDPRFHEYFLSNQAMANAAVARKPSAVSDATDDGSAASAPHSPDHQASVGEGSKKSGLMELLTIWVLAPLIFFFMSFDSGQARRYFLGLVPNRYFELSLTVLDMLDDAIGKYLRGTLIECALVGLSLEFGLFLLGIPFSVALFIGIVAGLANAIPLLGPAIGLVIALAYSLIAENITPLIPGLNPQDLAIYIVVLVGIVHVLDSMVFAPVVLGSAVNLHPLVVIIAIIAGSLMAGVWGMLLAIPALVVLKTGVETLFKELKAYRII